LVLAVVGCAVASAALLLAADQVWLEAAIPLEPVGRTATFRGSELVPELSAIGILAGIAALALIAGGRVIRVIVGSVLVLAGLLAIVTCGLRIGDQGKSFADAWAQRLYPTADSGTVLADSEFLAAPAWLALSGGGIALAVGVLTIVRCRRWPVMGARYERRAAPVDVAGPGTSSTVDGSASNEEADPLNEVAMWSALERGEDPTAASSDARSEAVAEPPDQPVSGR